MTKSTVLNTINQNIDSALNGLTSYKQGIQKALDLFVKNYSTKLSGNNEPLQRILNGVKENDKKLVKKYLTDFTNIQLTTNAKGNLSIKSTNDSDIDFIKTPDRKWYQKAEKESESKEWNLIETLERFIKKAEKEGYSKADITKALSKM